MPAFQGGRARMGRVAHENTQKKPIVEPEARQTGMQKKTMDWRKTFTKGRAGWRWNTAVKRRKNVKRSEVEGWGPLENKR